MDKIDIKKSPKKILIIKPSSLGDIVHSLPFLQALKDGFPDAEIHWVIARGLEGLLEDHPMIKKLLVIDKDKWKKLEKIKDTASELVGISKELKRESYDVVIDLQGLLRSGLLAYATHASVRIGFKEAREGGNLFYTHKVRGGRDIHAVDRYLKIAAALGCETANAGFPMPIIKESDKVKRLKENAGDYAVIVPGARWETKKWSPEKFGRLASMLDTKSIIIGSKSDIEISGRIEAASKGRALSTAGDTDIKELISIIRGARYVVTNDSGPMHIAAALGIPVIAIFGPTNPERTGPYGKNNIIIIRSDIHCSPCYKKKCKTMRCMEDISVERVYKEICGYCSS